MTRQQTAYLLIAGALVSAVGWFLPLVTFGGLNTFNFISTGSLDLQRIGLIGGVIASVGSAGLALLLLTNQKVTFYVALAVLGLAVIGLIGLFLVWNNVRGQSLINVDSGFLAFAIGLIAQVVGNGIAFKNAQNAV